MKPYARIENSVVAEIIELPDDIDPKSAFHPSLKIVACSNKVRVSWIYDGKIFSSPAPIETPLDPIPTITPRQLRLWLLSRALLAQVPTLIKAMPEPDKSVAQIEWEFATVFDHEHPFMQALGAAVGLSPDDIEAGFREASLL